MLNLVVVYVLLPAPMVLVGIKSQDDDGLNLWVQFGYCIGGFILSCLFGRHGHHDFSVISLTSEFL